MAFMTTERGLLSSRALGMQTIAHTCFFFRFSIIKRYRRQHLKYSSLSVCYSGVLGMAVFVTGSSLILRKASPRSVHRHSLFGGSMLFGLFLFIMGGSSGAIILSGALKMAGSGLSIAVGYIAFFSGLKIIGPVKASICSLTSF